MPGKASPLTHALLREIVARYDAAARLEQERWGGELRSGLDVTPEAGHRGAALRRLVDALEAAGAIVVRRVTREVEGPLRKTRSGRLLGGTHRAWTGSWQAWPTAEGRRLAAALP